MADHLLLRGYAIPFNQVAFVPDENGGFLEEVLPYAFNSMLRNRDKVTLQFDSHDAGAPVLAGTSDGALRLFADDYGLGFEAKLSGTDANWAIIRSVIRTHGYASVYFSKVATDRERASEQWSSERRRVVMADISHITIADSGAVYKGTSVWPAHADLERAPMRIRDAADRWETGNRQAFDKARATRRVSQALAKASLRGASCSHDEADSRRAFLSAALAQAFAGNSQVIGHAALSRASIANLPRGDLLKALANRIGALVE